MVSIVFDQKFRDCDLSARITRLLRVFYGETLRVCLSRFYFTTAFQTCAFIEGFSKNKLFSNTSTSVGRASNLCLYRWSFLESFATVTFSARITRFVQVVLRRKVYICMLTQKNLYFFREMSIKMLR